MSTPLAAWFDQTLLIRGKDAEIARLTECLRVAGLQCFMSTGKPEEVANHMASIAKANTDTIDRLTAEVERLRGSKERLATCVRAYEAWNQRLSKSVYCDGYWPDHEHRKAFFDALTVCHAHNDLAPPAKEDSDG